MSDVAQNLVDRLVSEFDSLQNVEFFAAMKQIKLEEGDLAKTLFGEDAEPGSVRIKQEGDEVRICTTGHSSWLRTKTMTQEEAFQAISNELEDKHG